MLRTCPNMTLAVERDVKHQTFTLPISRIMQDKIKKKFPSILATPSKQVLRKKKKEGDMNL